MEGLVGEEEDFVGYAGLDRQPVEVDEGGGDVLPWLCMCEYPSSTVLNILEPVQGFVGDPKQDTIAVVQAGGDKSMD